MAQDYAQAMRWSRKAAQARYVFWFGRHNAMYNIGYMYEKGLGVPKNLPQALYWYKTETADGYPDGQKQVDRLTAVGGDRGHGAAGGGDTGGGDAGDRVREFAHRDAPRRVTRRSCSRKKRR